MRTVPAFLLTSIALLAGCASSSQAQVPAPPAIPERERPVIQASGNAQVSVTPDRAAIMLGVTTRGTNVTEATAENARIQRSVIDAVRRQGIPAERIGTTGFSVNPEYRHDPRGERPPTITGYHVHNIVRVEVHQVDRIGAIIDAALAAGSNNMQGIHFWSSTMNEARRRALSEAVANARADAEAMARAAGGELGALEALQHGVIPDVRPMPGVAYRMEAAQAADTPIMPGEQTFTVTVMGRWLFAPGR